MSNPLNPIVAVTLMNAREVLELRLSDTIEFEPAPRVNIEISFFHANERHHSFALAPRPPRPRLRRGAGRRRSARI